VGEYLSSERSDFSGKRGKEIKMFLEEKGRETKFNEVFRELHASAERGNDLDRQLLVDLIFEPIYWYSRVPGSDNLCRTRKIKFKN
jgi:hypothetical protein